ncbi:MAG: SRPBCC family protein [Alphaproteobacteria bacterium]|nr:SRPBCC family protein [Alphaproteobacteria bacterium]
MSILLLLAGSAAAQAPDSDVSVSGIVPHDRATIAPRLRDTTSLAALFADCTVDWEHGVTPKGPARVTYRIMSFRRRLTATVSERDPDHVIELDHAGAKGFVTRFTLTPEGEGTSVAITTYLNPPGWPFRKYYYDTVMPAWRSCYEAALTRLETP